MDDVMTLDEALEVLEGRASIYGLLSAVYGAEIRSGGLAQLREQMSEQSDEEDSPGYALLRQFFQQTACDDASVVETELAADYASLFLSMGRKPVPPYESVYTSEERLLMQRARDEVLAMYREEGLGRSDSFREPEDHIAIEFEFMAYLCQKAMELLEADDTEAANGCLQKQSEFLNKHLLVWVPQFCKDVQESARTDFYKAIAQITDEHLSYEGDTIAELMEAI